MKRLLIDSFTSVFIRVLGSLSAFGLTYVIANQFSSIDAGSFFFLLSVLFILSSVCRFGLDNVFLKLVGEKKILIKEDFETIKSGFSLTIIGSVFFVTLALVFYSFNFLTWFTFIGIVTLLPIYNFIFLFGMILQGQGKTIRSILVLNILINLLSCIFVYIFNINNLNFLILTYVISNSIVFLLCLYLNYKISIATFTSKMKFIQVVTKSFPFFIFTFNGQMQIWFGQLCLGLFTLSSAVANFAISLRVSLLLSFILVAINIVIAPKIAYYVKNNEYIHLQRLIKNSNKIIYIVSLPIFIVFCFNAELIIGLFGSQYSENLVVIYILLFGQLVNVLTGSVGYLLSMSGFERDLQFISLFSLSILVLLSLILVPLFSEVGAAISTCTAIIFQNTISSYYVKKRLGINVFSLFGKDM
jgi:O-antigen/teichoic acid export membrane protein